MAKACVVCEKTSSTGNAVSHSNRKTRRTWQPNLQRVRIVVNGSVRRAYVCAKCIKAGKVSKAV